MNGIGSNLVYENGGRIVFDSEIVDHIQNNFFTIVHSAEKYYGDYLVGFNIYRASSSYRSANGYWFDKSVYKMTDSEARSSRNFTRVASGTALIAPYKISDGYSYSLPEYYITNEYL